jgi:uncharacterized protein
MVSLRSFLDGWRLVDASRFPGSVLNLPFQAFATVAFCGLLALPGGKSSAASFDCRKAATDIERRVCAEPALSALDEKLDRAYREALDAAADKETIRRAQREWLTELRNRCPDANCLKGVYEARLAALADPGAQARKRELREFMKTFRPEPYIGEGDPFCQAFYEDFKVQRNIEHIAPVIRVETYDDPALAPIRARCPTLEMHKTMGFYHRDIEISGMPESEEDAESRAVSIGYGMRNFEWYTLDLNNKPDDGMEHVLYYEGERFKKGPSQPQPAIRTYQIIDVARCERKVGVLANQFGSDKWSRTGIIKYQGNYGIYELISYDRVIGKADEQPTFYILALDMHSKNLGRIGSRCTYQRPRN